ncbi:unnamed protein product [Phytophthora lilii]|uniref:Unnamed protein product n=1 Tax=Phytophthora lilii TaxID=2077276 RepID=A0A9W6U3C1_9STRA|nr:unnamed protein product [Phytophthora lilii]
MLDVCLLVLKAGLDYLATRRDYIGTLLKILSPLVIKTLSQLARSATLPNEATSSTISEARCLQTSLHVLTTLTSELGENELTIVIKIFERLLTFSLIRLNAVRSTSVSTFFDAVHKLVTQSNVATALQIGDLKDWYEEYLTARQDCPVKDTNTLKATRYVCSSDREFRGEDEASSEDHECTSLLSDMGIGDRPCRSKIDRADWFDDEDSEDEDSELEGIVLPPDESDEDEKESDQDKFAKVDDSNVSQWFGDDDDEEDELADIELPLEGYAEYLKLVPAAPLDGASQDDKDCNPNRVAEAEASSGDGSTSTDSCLGATGLAVDPDPDSWSAATSGSSTSASSRTASSSSTNSTAGSSTPSTTSSASSSGTSADTTSSASTGGLSSSLITYGAIGLGAVLIVVILIILCARRRKMRRRREENIAVSGAGNFGRNRALSDKRPRGLSKRDDAFAGPYNNILDSSKVNYPPPNVNAGYGGGYGGHRKGSRPEPMDNLSRVPTDESPRSFDGMLTDSTHSPAMLGGSTHTSHTSRGSQKSGGRSVQAAPVVGGIGGFSNVNEYVQQDVSSRCTSTPNVFGEYLRMKQEMQYDDADRSTMGGMSGVSFSDTISDLDSGKYSFESSQGIGRLPQRRTDLDGRSSMADSITDSIADSVTDSEYAEQLRARGESDCFSEMSYNDEKYSFSSLDGLDDSQVREGKREVEI